MFEEPAPKPAKGAIVPGCDLSDFSLGDIDERVAILEGEIERLKAERARKAQHLDAAQSFFKS